MVYHCHLQDYLKHFQLKNQHLNAQQSKFVDSEINELISDNVIEQCDDVVCISPLGCVPKKDGHRLIVDLREVNKFIDCPKLCYEDINTVKQVVQPGDHMITCDIKSGYHHIAVARDFQKYLGVAWKGKTYVWKKLPFRLNISAFYFVKVVRAVVAYVRSKGIRIISYVDDFCVCSKPDSIVADRDFFLNVLADLGFVINVKKSMLEPSTHVQFIGYVISTCNDDNLVWLHIPPNRIRKFKHDIGRALKKGCL